jgi:polyisoprenoid-binding protein YceI
VKKSSFIIVSAVSGLLASMLVVNSASAASNLTTAQQAKVKTLFVALASADPNKIKSAKLKNTAPDSKAFQFADFVQNYYSTVQYFKGINAYGQPNNKVLTLETKGSVKVSASSASLNSSYNSFDFTASSFTFNKSGKISSWSTKSTVDGKNKKLSTLLFEVDTTSSSGGLNGSTGYVYVQPDNGTTFQVLVTNSASNLKSWSYTGGQYGAPNNKWFKAESNPSGCLYPGQSAFFIAEMNETPQIVSGTGAAFEAPIFNGCGVGSASLGGEFRFITN